MPRSVYRISRDVERTATVASLAELDLFGEDTLPGVYDVDVIHADPIEGLTSWQGGTLTKHVHGVVTFNEDLQSPDQRC